MCLGAIAGVGSALIGASASSKAASAQKEAAQMQAMTEIAQYRQALKRTRPYRQAGDTALDAYMYELGLGPKPVIGGTAPEIVEFNDTPANVDNSAARNDAYLAAINSGDPYNPNAYTAGGSWDMANQPDPVTKYRVGDQVFATKEAAEAYAAANPTGGTEYQGFQETPGYQFQLEQGLNAIDNSAASRGNIFSGATLKRSQEYGQGLANQEYNNYLTRLAGMTDTGVNVAGMQNVSGANAAAGMSSALGNYGNASAAGAIGGANALLGGINTGLGIWNYQQGLSSPQSAQNALNSVDVFGIASRY